MERFLENREYFVAVKTGINNEPISSVAANERETVKENNNRYRTFTLGPLPLEIEDILKIVINCDDTQIWRSYQKIYGQNFKTVMFYGRCKPVRGCIDSQKGRNVKLYEVDDGTGIIVVHFPHSNSKYSGNIISILTSTERICLFKKTFMSVCFVKTQTNFLNFSNFFLFLSISIKWWHKSSARRVCFG